MADIKVIKKQVTVKEPEEKKVVVNPNFKKPVIKRKTPTVNIKPKVAEEVKPVAAVETKVATEEPKVAAPVKTAPKFHVKPQAKKIVPEANTNIIGGERVSSTLHSGPIVIKASDLPPISGAKAPVGDKKPRVAGVVGGRPVRGPRQFNNNNGNPNFQQRQGNFNNNGQNGNNNGPNGNRRGNFNNRPGDPNGRPNFNNRGQGGPGGFNRPGGQGGFNNRGQGGPRPPGQNQGFARKPFIPRTPGQNAESIESVQKTGARKVAGKKKDSGDYKKAKNQEIDFHLQQKKKDEAKLAAIPKLIEIMENVTVADLAKKMNLKASDIISKLFKMGMMVTINQQIDYDTAEIIAAEYGASLKLVSLYDETIIESDDTDETELVNRAPIVTIMGHVDHGKTKLLDAIRKTDVVSGEFGGITQHIGAYKVRTETNHDIVFLDTPGHAAFSMMRARGAQVTDIVVLVVAANDGVMPQTREAVDHALAAKVPIIVAINKCDLPDSNPDRIMQQLSDVGLIPEEWGGQTLYCKISALKKQGINELLDTIMLQSEMLELSANPNCRAVGKVLESRIDQGRGTVATIMVEKGTLKQGDYYVAGIYSGRVRAMFDDKGNKIKSAGPSTPVEIIGLSNIPSAGDPFQVTEDEKQARMVGSKRQELEKLGATTKGGKITLENLYDKIKEGEMQELNVIIKGDVQGSVEALQSTLVKLSTDEIRLNVIRASAGAIIESDISLASASSAVVIGFNVRPTPRAQALAENEKVEIKKYNVIYDVVDDMKLAMEGMLSPEIKELDIGTAVVREVFKIPRIGLIAGSYITSGKVVRNAFVRVIRDNIQINKENIQMTSLKRFKDDAKEVTAGYECGIGLLNFQDLQVDDTLEFVVKQEIARKLTETKV